MKAIGYFREPEPGTRGESLSAQNKEFLAFCEQKGYDVAVTFVETVERNGQRPGFRQLVDYLKRPDKGFVLVVSRSFDTLGVDSKEALRRYFQIEGLGAQVAFITGPEDPIADVAQQLTDGSETAKLSERVRAAMRRKAVRGEVLGRPPYGYRVGARRRLELVPDEAVVVRYIFRLYLQDGLGIRLIARRLNEEGYRTRRGGNWSMVSIRDILRNRVYLGTYARFGVRVPGSHPALVTPDDYRAVQERLSARRNNYAERSPSTFLLAGLVQCGHCGNKMIGVSRRQTWKRRSGSEGKAAYRYYQCESRTNQSVCDYHTQRADELEDGVRNSLVTMDGDTLAPVAGNEAAVAAELQTELERLHGRLRQLDRKLEDHLSAATKGRINREQLQQRSIATTGERLRIEEAVEDIERRVHEQADSGQRRRAREKSLTKLIDGWTSMAFHDVQLLLRELVDRIVVRDDGVQLVLRP
jgi:DNA invertase Pin-like site-specific DNA recombinase